MYRVTRHTMVHEQMSRFFQGFRRDAHPMAVMVGSVGALSAFYHDCIDISDPQQRMIASIRMIAKMPTLAAMAYKYSIGQPFVYPKNDLDYATNFLRMCFAVPAEDYKAEPGAGARHGPHLHPARRPRAERLDLDGAARRLVGRQSVRLHRRRHRLPVGPGARRRQRGRAQDAGRDRPRRPHPRIHQARQGQERLLPPDGLRPPRLQELRSARQDHAEDLPRGAGRDSATRTIRCSTSRMELERIALKDEYFIEKKLYPNIDFYSGITLEGDGLPDLHVHGAVRARAHGRLDRPVEGDDRGPEPEDRPPAPALHRRAASATTCRSRGGSDQERGAGRPVFVSYIRSRPAPRARSAPRRRFPSSCRAS